MASDFFLVSCEHGGNRIPSRYLSLFSKHEALLSTHRGYDAGALHLARELSCALHAPLHASTVSRLLIDLNRSVSHPRVYSEATRAASATVRQEIFQRYYQPYRTKVETQIAQAVADGNRVIHISCHSFTPELDGKTRDADIGLLYDPARPGEQALCQHWRNALRLLDPALTVRLNYPYAGTSDGFTTALRGHLPEDIYLGIEVEINQQHVLEGPRHWHDVRRTVIEALRRALPG